MVTFTLNGQETTYDGDPDTPLLWVIRDDARLTGTKYGCGVSACVMRLHRARRRLRRALEKPAPVTTLPRRLPPLAEPEGPHR